MRKMLLLIAFWVLAFAVPAQAQAIRWGYIPTSPEGWYYKVQGDQVGMITADNLGMVRRMSAELRRTQIRSVSEDLIWNGNAYGLRTPRGFYPMYNREMKPMSRREATITGAAIGAGIGYGVSGNSRGGAIGAAVGGFVGLITGGRRRNKEATTTSEQDMRSSYWRSGDADRRLDCMEREMLTLENQSGGPLRIFNNGKPLEVLMPKGRMCAPLDGSYTGEVVDLVVASDGVTGRVSIAPAEPEVRPGLTLVWR